MNTNKVIVTLLVLTIVLSAAIVALSSYLVSNSTVVIGNSEGADTATIVLYVEGADNTTPSAQKEGSGVGLYVESGN